MQVLPIVHTNYYLYNAVTYYIHNFIFQGDVTSSTPVTSFPTSELSPSPSRSVEDNTVYNLKVSQL